MPVNVSTIEDPPRVAVADAERLRQCRPEDALPLRPPSSSSHSASAEITPMRMRRNRQQEPDAARWAQPCGDVEAVPRSWRHHTAAVPARRSGDGGFAPVMARPRTRRPCRVPQCACGRAHLAPAHRVRRWSSRRSPTSSRTRGGSSPTSQGTGTLDRHRRRARHVGDVHRRTTSCACCSRDSGRTWFRDPPGLARVRAHPGSAAGAAAARAHPRARSCKPTAGATCCAPRSWSTAPGAAAVLIYIASLAVLEAERPAPGASITTFGDRTVVVAASRSPRPDTATTCR